MKYCKILLPFLAISRGQEDGGDEEDRQCENCEGVSILIVGGEAANGNIYGADGDKVIHFKVRSESNHVTFKRDTGHSSVLVVSTCEIL